MPASLTRKTRPSDATGDACIGTPLVCSQATSGGAPGRTARTVGAPKPDTVTTSPPAITGDGTTPSPVLETDHSRAPVPRSNACTTSPAGLTSTSPTPMRATMGVTCAIRDSPRLAFQRCRPVRASSAMMKD